MRWFFSQTGYWSSVILFFIVFTGCMIGIWTRPVGFLASVWPANAFMLIVLLRLPVTARWHGWLAGAGAFMLADLLTGSDLVKAVLLNSANLVSVAVAYSVLFRLPAPVLRLQEPVSVLYLVLAALLGGAAAGLIGSYTNVVLFNTSALSGFFIWWITETVNYVSLLPILLTAPPLALLFKSLHRRNWTIRRLDILPALAVIASCAAGLFIGGPGAIAFPILALLWCALVYPVFPTAVLTLLCSLFALLFVSNGYLPGYSEELNRVALFSIRLGVALIAIAPVMLSVVIQNHHRLLAELRYLTTHDALTDVGSRTAFREEAERILKESRVAHAVLMIDLDRFKSINDSYGHAAGDEVLCTTARRISGCLRPADRIGRMGGEEFAVFLRDCSAFEALEIAERIRLAVASQPILLQGGMAITVTVSIGVTVTGDAGLPTDLDRLLSEADTALYRSKENGRDRVEIAVQ